MPVPTPNQGESHDDFIGRCMADETMAAEYEDEAQRYAVCNNLWEKSQKSLRSAVEALLGDIEIRTFHRGELRLAGDGEGLGTIIGSPGIPYNQPSEDLGGFVERISPHALDDTILLHDVVCCRDHEDHLVLGRVSAGTLFLENTPHGLNYACSLPDTTYARDLAELVRRGDVRGSSFRFTVLEDEWDGNMREIKRMELYEVGPVTLPAYPSTSLSLRSLLCSFGVDTGALSVAVRRARSGELQSHDIDTIMSAIRALTGCLPSSGQGAQRGTEEARQGLELLRMRLRALEF